MKSIIIAIFAFFSALNVGENIVSADQPSIQLDIRFATIDALSYTHLMLKNAGETSARIDTITVRYGCANGGLEIVDHEPRLSIAPGAASAEIEGGIVCAAQQGAVAYKLLSVNENLNVIAEDGRIYYRIQCGDGFALYVTLEWQQAKNDPAVGYYTYATSSGASGTLDGKVIEDGSFGQIVCSPSPPPFQKAFGAFYDFARKHLYEEDGKAKKLSGQPAEVRIIKR